MKCLSLTYSYVSQQKKKKKPLIILFNSKLLFIDLTIKCLLLTYLYVNFWLK